jgi:ribose 1,5-bisphosphokinase
MDAARQVLADDSRFRFVRREITRPADAGGEDHLPIDAAEFARRRAAGAYALAWEAHGMGYGIPADIEADLRRGRVVVANVSRAVIAKAASRFATRVLEITAAPEVLAARLGTRGREDAADVQRRLRRAVPLPDDVEVVTVLNHSSVAKGAAMVVAILNCAAETALPG